MLKFGVTLPVFARATDTALAVADRAEALGLDGVFVFDHLWPMNAPERPALHGPSVLAAVATRTERVTLGTLVTRVTVRPWADLAEQFATLHAIAGGRLVAGLGLGDSLSRPENESYGLAFPPIDQRVAELERLAAALRREGVTSWVGGRGRRAIDVAGRVADGWNAWEATPEVLAADAVVAAAGRPPDVTTPFTVSWGGRCLLARDAAGVGAKRERFPAFGAAGQGPVGTAEDLAAHARSVHEAGAAWAIYAPVDVGADVANVEIVAEARELLR